MKKNNNNLGFTLVELLVVIAIISILITILIVAINPVQQIRSAQDTRRRADLNQIKAGMQLYYNECKFYPTTANFTAISGTSWGNISGNSCDDSTTYMRRVPNDPVGGAQYQYSTTSGCDNSSTMCSNYVIGATLVGTVSTEDTNTTTKCSYTATSTTNTNTGTFKVCND